MFLKAVVCCQRKKPLNHSGQLLWKHYKGNSSLFLLVQKPLIGAVSLIPLGELPSPLPPKKAGFGQGSAQAFSVCLSSLRKSPTGAVSNPGSDLSQGASFSDHRDNVE